MNKAGSSALIFQKGDAQPGLFIVLVNLKVNGTPEYYVYEYPVLAERVSQIYQAYISTPKRDGTPKKEVGFRWFDEISFNDDDRSRKNNWQPIIKALTTTGPYRNCHVYTQGK